MAGTFSPVQLARRAACLRKRARRIAGSHHAFPSVAPSARPLSAGALVCLLPVVLVVLAACGTRRGSSGQGGKSGGGGEADMSRGGSGGQAGGSTGGSAGVASQDGGSDREEGATESDARPATDALCETGRLWSAVADAALGVGRLGECYALPTGTYGAIVLESEGRVIDNTGTVYQSTGSKQAWLDSLSNESWPCLAGQTIPYQCVFD
jgi:hypothetical protein